MGNGVRLSHAEKEFRELTQVLNLPWAQRGSPWICSERKTGWAWAVLACWLPGAQTSPCKTPIFCSRWARAWTFAVSGWNRQELARQAHKVMVDVDAAELAKLSDAVQQPICSDAGDFLRELLAQKAAIEPAGRCAWNTDACSGRAVSGHSGCASREGPGQHLSSGRGDCRAAEPGDQLLSGSSGVGIEIFLFAYPSRTGQRVIHTAGLGAMGYGIAASIGISIATGHSRTICVDGDGGFQMNIQELATVAHHRLPLKFFVLNNGGYAAIRGSQQAIFGGPNIGCDARRHDLAGHMRGGKRLWTGHSAD